MKIVIWVALTVVLFGCGRPHPNSMGVKDLAEMRVAADKFFIEGSPGLFMQSADTCQMSKDQLGALTEFAAGGWRNATLRQHHRWTKMLDPAEHVELEKEIQKTWSDWLKSDPPIWNHQPEKYLVYFFQEMDGDKEKAHLYLTIGLFRRDGLWYFAGQYRKK